MSNTTGEFALPNECVVHAAGKVDAKSRLQLSGTLIFLLRTATILVGFAFISLAFFRGEFRDSENNLTGLVMIPFTTGIGFVFSGIAIGRRWMQAAFWLVLGLIGHVVSLQQINAGWQLRYQHYKPVEQIAQTGLGIILLAFLILQATVVLLALRRYMPAVVAWCRKNFQWWQVLFIATAFALTSATVSKNVSVYLEELLFAVFIQIVSFLTLLLAIIKLPPESVRSIKEWSRKIIGNEGTNEHKGHRTLDAFSVLAAIFVMMVAALLCAVSYEFHPHVPDEVAYLIQARWFANGVMTMPMPAVPQAFEAYLMDINGGVWYPVTPPGWPLILSVGMLLKAPFLVNPLLAGVNVLLAYAFLNELFSKRTARLAIALMVCSPWYIFLGMSFMTHMSALTCALAAALGVLAASRKGIGLPAFMGGLALGFLSLVRPLEAVVIAALIGLRIVGIGANRLKLSGMAFLVFGTLITGSIGLAYNFAITGHPLTFPINTYTDKTFGRNSNAFGFGPDRGMGWELDPYPGHGPLDAIVNSNLNATALNTELLGWSIGSFLMIALGVCIGRPTRGELAMLAVIGLIYLLHFFYYFSGGPDFGARYWFLMFVPLIVLTVSGINKLTVRLDRDFENGGTRVMVAVAALCVTTLIAFVPWRAIDKYHNFRGMRPDIAYLAEVYSFDKSLVLIEGNKHPDFDSALVYNPIDLNADAPIYAWDRGYETRQALLRAYPDRAVWFVKGPSITQKGFEIASGPIPARDLLKNEE